MNLLQSIPESKFGPVLVTLNPPFPPAKEKTLGSWDYEHPYMSSKVSIGFSAILRMLTSCAEHRCTRRVAAHTEQAGTFVRWCM